MKNVVDKMSEYGFNGSSNMLKNFNEAKVKRIIHLSKYFCVKNTRVKKNNAELVVN